MERFDRKKGLELLEAVRSRKQRPERPARRISTLDAERYQAYGDELARSLEAELSERSDALVRGMRRATVAASDVDDPDSDPSTSAEATHADAG